MNAPPGCTSNSECFVWLCTESYHSTSITLQKSSLINQMLHIHRKGCVQLTTTKLKTFTYNIKGRFILYLIYILWLIISPNITFYTSFDIQYTHIIFIKHIQWMLHDMWCLEKTNAVNWTTHILKIHSTK